MLLLIGNYTGGELAIAQQVAQSFGGRAKGLRHPEELAEIALCDDLRGVLIQPGVPFLAGAYRLLGIMHPFVPIVETSDGLSKDTLLAGLRRGAVDVIERRDLRDLSSRMQTLCGNSTQRPALLEKQAVLVAHENELERLRLLRAFRLAGYAAKPVSSADASPLHEGGELLVISESMWFAAQRARKMWKKTLILRPHQEVHHPPMVEDHTALISENADAQQMVLLAQQLGTNGLSGAARPAIVSECICAIRVLGRSWRSMSVHRMDGRSLFVRTLEHVEIGAQAWIEFDAGDGEFVSLRGNVTAVRSLDTPGAEPPGFQLTLDASQCPADDLRKYKRSYRRLSQLIFGGARAVIRGATGVNTNSVEKVSEPEKQQPFPTTYRLIGKEANRTSSYITDLL